MNSAACMSMSTTLFFKSFGDLPECSVMFSVFIPAILLRSLSDMVG